MKTKDLKETKRFGIIKRFIYRELSILIAGVVILVLFMGFSDTDDVKDATSLLYNLSNELGKRGGCDAPKDALVLLEAYQIIYREIGGIPDRRNKISIIRKLIIDKGCSTQHGNINFNPIDIKPATITTISGGITIKSEVSPYILALEMMTPKQKKEFLSALPESNQSEYLNWEKDNTELKQQIQFNLIRKEVIPVDRNTNWGNVFQKAIEENKSLNLDDYQINEKELKKLLNNQQLIQELNKQILKEDIK
jgi:hypothetical protein